MNKLIPNSTQIPNVIMDYALPQLPEAEGRILLYISRRTYGFHKSEDRISFSQFLYGIKDSEDKILDYGTGLARASLNLGLKSLASAGAIFIKKDTKGNLYKINLEMDPDKVVQLVNQFRKRTKSGSLSRPKAVQLVNTQKKEKQRETKIYSAMDLNQAELLYSLIKENNPAWYVKPNWTQWANDIRKLREIDKRSSEQIEFIIHWCQRDNFWHKNILSPEKLRKQFNVLVVQANPRQSTPKVVL